MEEVFGLPAHPLLVHGAVVVIPLVALGTAGIALVGWLRRRVGWLVVAGALACVALVPLVTSSGEALEDRVPETDLVEEHTELGETLLPWVVALAGAAVAVMVVELAAGRPRSDGGAGNRMPAWALVATVLAAVLALPIAAVTVVQVIRIGHSGSAAVWSDRDGTTVLDDEDEGEDETAVVEEDDGGSGSGSGRGRGRGRGRD